MRATHPNLLKLPLLAAALIALTPLTAAAADLAFADGMTWTDVKIVSQEPTSTIAYRGNRMPDPKPQSLTPLACSTELVWRNTADSDIAK